MKELWWTSKTQFGSYFSNSVSEYCGEVVRLFGQKRFIPTAKVNSGEPFNGNWYFDSKEKLEHFVKISHYHRDYYNEYALFGRLLSDCKAYIDGDTNHLWGITPEEHINKMYEIYDMLPADGKPEGITRDDIEHYEALMIAEA